MFRAFLIVIFAVLTIAANQVPANPQSSVAPDAGLVLRSANSESIYQYSTEAKQGRSGTGGGAEGNEVDMPAVSSSLTKYQASIVVENVGVKSISAVTWLQSEETRRKSITWHRFRIQQVILPGKMAELRKLVLTESPIGRQAVIDKIEYEDGTTWQRHPGSESHLGSVPSEVRLLPSVQHHDKRSLFNFELGVGADLAIGSAYDLRFGGYSLNGDSSWFEVAKGEDSHCQIRDLGEQAWNAISEVPVVPASVEIITGKMTFDYRAGPPAHVSPENVLVKAIVGHIYVVHTKTDKIDRYAMFRVESIDPNGVCTISWKLVRSPESK